MYQVAAGQKFDVDYYMKKHMPLVDQRWKSVGLKGWQVMQGTGTPTGSSAPYHVITLLDFESLDAFKRAIDANGPEIMGDVANFTDTQPSIQFNNKLG
jgi:uncharacterized protein (TIGR02118 family)